MWTAQPDEAQGPTSSLSLPKTVSVTPAPEPGPVVESLAPTAQIAAEPMAAVPSDVPAHGASDLAQRHAASSRPENTLTQELSLLAQAQDALRADNPSGALAFAREHKRRYPRGSLREERQGIEALARCSLGHNGLKVLKELQRVSPNSPLLERVRTACIKP